MKLISPKRTAHLHNVFAQIGFCGKHSVTRFGYSDLESAAHQTYSDLLLQIPGWRKEVDVFGNTHFILDGTDPSLAPIRIGSHLDSVNQAGLFDGTSGCISGILIAEYLYNHGIRLQRTLVISIWRCEESTRFGAAMVGSRLFCGLMSFKQLENITDSSGISILGGMISQGVNESALRAALRNWKIPATALYQELHIEQGPELLQAGVDVGIVTRFCGTWRAQIDILGRKDHSSRKNTLRNDAMRAAMRIGDLIYSLVDNSQEYPVVTIGGLSSDGSMNCIAGKVSFTVDVRGISKAKLVSLGEKIKRIVAKEASKFEVGFKIKEKGLVSPVGTSTKLQRKLQRVANEYGFSYMRIPSGAGHDGMSFALADIDSILMFCPSSSRRRNGAYSHSYQEFATNTNIARTTAFMLRTILS